MDPESATVTPCKAKSTVNFFGRGKMNQQRKRLLMAAAPMAPPAFAQSHRVRVTPAHNTRIAASVRRGSEHGCLVLAAAERAL